MNYEAVIESILFTMGDSVELSKLAEVLELDKNEGKDIIEQMQKNYEAEDRGITSRSWMELIRCVPSLRCMTT